MHHFSVYNVYQKNVDIYEKEKTKNNTKKEKINVYRKKQSNVLFLGIISFEQKNDIKNIVSARVDNKEEKELD